MTAPESNTNCQKEEMPEAPLFSTTSHIPSVLSLETNLISNGNHLAAVESVQSTPAIARFYSYPKRTQSKSAPAMGAADSKAPSDAKLNQLFDGYKDRDDDAILEEGIEQLCKDLQVSPEDFRVLLLAWKLNAEMMCRFTRVEFVGGLRRIRVDSIRALQARLPELVAEVDANYESFKALYRFTFKFGLDAASGERILPTETAMVLWRLVFTVREPPILRRWLNFLKQHEQYRGIPKDTWNMFLNFSDTVGDDLSSYDDNEAWPSIFDDFVEFENDQANQNVAKEDNLMILKDG